MRETLFRGKTHDGRWVEGFLFKLSNDDYSWCIGIEPLSANDYGEIYDMSYDEIIPETVGQYTGLKDKNGTKIFEGDTCKDSLGWEFTVIWDAENARFLGTSLRAKGDTYIHYVGREPAVEVIGNVHEREGDDE